MRTFTLFYAWQSDRPSELCRSFVREALKSAADKILETRQITVLIDSDTQGVPGTPPVSDTILRKIDDCDGFLADLTLVASTDADKKSPNPNVLVEYGYALKAKGHARVILAMNTAFGSPDFLPFDLRHLRHPLKFEAGPGLADAERRKRRARFSDHLVTAINAVIDAPRAAQRRTSRTTDPETAVLKHLNDFRSRRGAIGPRWHMSSPRALIDVAPFALLDERRLDLRVVKAARPSFAPAFAEAVETTTQQGRWISRDPPQQVLGLPNPVSSWATSLTSQGHLERAFAVGDPDEFGFEQLIDGRELDSRIVDALQRSGTLLDAVGLGGPAMIGLTIEGGECLRLSRGKDEGQLFGSPFMTFGPIRVDHLAQPDAVQVRPLLDDLWQAAGWEDGTPSITDAGWATALTSSNPT